MSRGFVAVDRAALALCQGDDEAMCLFAMTRAQDAAWTPERPEPGVDVGRTFWSERTGLPEGRVRALVARLVEHGRAVVVYPGDRTRTKRIRLIVDVGTPNVTHQPTHQPSTDHEQPPMPVVDGIYQPSANLPPTDPPQRIEIPPTTTNQHDPQRALAGVAEASCPTAPSSPSSAPLTAPPAPPQAAPSSAPASSARSGDTSPPSRTTSAAQPSMRSPERAPTTTTTTMAGSGTGAPWSSTPTPLTDRYPTLADTLHAPVAPSAGPPDLTAALYPHADLAKRLAAYVSTVDELRAKSVEELQFMPGVGPDRAARIAKLMAERGTPLATKRATPKVSAIPSAEAFADIDAEAELAAYLEREQRRAGGAA